MTELEIKCDCIDICRDVKKLRENEKKGIIDEDLYDQYQELCTGGGAGFKCLLRESYLKDKEIKK